MLIALITLLITGGGSNEIFLIPEVEKYLKEIIIEEDRQEEVFLFFDMAKEDAKEFNKEYQTHRKELKKTLDNRSASREEISIIFSNAFEDRNKYQARMIDRNLAVRSLITVEEFDSLMHIALISNEKEQEKLNKSHEKNIQKMQKILVDIRESIRKNIGDQSNNERLVNHFDQLEKSFIEYLENLRDLNFNEQKKFREKDISKSELNSIFKELDIGRVKFSEHFMDFRFEIVERGNDKEWKKISKQLNKLF